MNKKVIAATLFTLVLLKILVISISYSRTFNNEEEIKQKALEDIKRGNVHLLFYGLPDDLFLIMEKPLTDRLGFKYKNLGCGATKEDQEKIKIYNNQVIEYLSYRNGKNWYTKFLESQDSLENYLNLNRDSLEKTVTEEMIQSVIN